MCEENIKIYINICLNNNSYDVKFSEKKIEVVVNNNYYHARLLTKAEDNPYDKLIKGQKLSNYDWLQILMDNREEYMLFKKCFNSKQSKPHEWKWGCNERRY